MALVTGRIVAIKRNTESIVDRESTERVHVDADNGFLHLSIVARADGRADVEVKTKDGKVMQYLNLDSEGRLLAFGGTIIDGAAL